MRWLPVTIVLEPLCAAAFGVWMLAFVVASQRVTGFAVSTSDFQDYCFAVMSFGSGRWDLWPSQRSVLAGALPGILAGSGGILPGLVNAALLSAFGWVAGVFLWTRAIAGRRAAWLAVAWLPCFGPLVILTRTVSFYPEVVFFHVAAGAAVAGALARGTRGWLVAAPVALGVLPLADLRSVLFLLALLPVAVLAGAVAKVGRWGRVAAALAPLATVAASWRFGAWSYPASAASLQAAVYRYALDASRLAGVTWSPPEGEGGAAFRWAQGSPASLLDALRYLQAVDASRPAALSARTLLQPGSHEVLVMAPWLALAAVVAVITLRRRPRALAALVLTGAPFLVVLRSTMMTLPHPRQLAMGSVVLPVVLGAACAGALFGLDWARRRGVAARPWLGWRGWPAVLAALAVIGVSVVLAGVPATALGPTQQWRGVMIADDEPRASLAILRGEAAPDPGRMCVVALTEDAKKGHPLVVPWFAPAISVEAAKGRR
ncbi:hypothetical protein LBMAG42_05010 [Deltaproteobacteria bacterium]|nr:hypothetical protein LBMAG42_05010 [Deltaproteobacteria bacterium]